MSIKSNLPEKELHVFVFPNSKTLQKKMGIRWFEKHEFMYNGNMYDVVSEKADGNFVIYKCINDKQESKLFAGLQNQIRNSMNNDPVKSKTLNILQKFNLIFINIKYNYLYVSQLNVRSFFIYHKNFFENLPKEVITPPPQYI